MLNEWYRNKITFCPMSLTDEMPYILVLIDLTLDPFPVKRDSRDFVEERNMPIVLCLLSEGEGQQNLKNPEVVDQIRKHLEDHAKVSMSASHTLPKFTLVLQWQ